MTFLWSTSELDVGSPVTVLVLQCAHAHVCVCVCVCASLCVITVPTLVLIIMTGSRSPVTHSVGIITSACCVRMCMCVCMHVCMAGTRSPVKCYYLYQTSARSVSVVCECSVLVCVCVWGGGVYVYMHMYVVYAYVRMYVCVCVHVCMFNVWDWECVYVHVCVCIMCERVCVRWLYPILMAGAGSPVQCWQAGGEEVHSHTGGDRTAALQERHQQGQHGVLWMQKLLPPV